MLRFLLSFLVLALPFSLSAQLSTTVSKTDITCFGDSNGTASVVGTIPGAGPPIVISQVDLGAPDWIELTNVSGAPVNTSGWFLCVSETPYSNISTVNSTVWNLPGSVPAGWVDYKTDGSVNPWGSNLFWNPGSYPTFTGWALLSDDQGNIVDFVAWSIPETEILNTLSFTSGGFNFNISTAEWTGTGVDGNCSTTLTRDGNSDNDDANDWSCTTGSQGSLNPSMSLPFAGSGLSVSYLWSTGDTTNSITGLGPGTYTVTTSDSNTSIVDTITIIEPPIPPFDIPTDDTVLCDQGAFIVDAGPGWSSYQWSNGNTSQSAIINTSGTIFCTVTDTNGCPATDSVVVTEGSTPDVNLGADSTVCADEWVLNAGGGGVDFNWSDGSSGQFLTVTESGTYSVTVTSVDGCQAFDNVTLTVFPEPEVDLGNNISLCINTSETQFISAGSSFTFYQWNTGATSSQLLVGSGVTQPGSEDFSVIVTDANGCTATDTITVNYDICSGLNDDIASSAIAVYPNPSKGLVVIESGVAIEGVQLFDLTGKQVYNNQLAGGKTLVNLDFSTLSKGSYIMKVKQPDAQQTIRFVLE